MVERFDASIRLGDDLRILQNGEVIGLARAVAHGWEWGGTPGTSPNPISERKRPEQVRGSPLAE